MLSPRAGLKVNDLTLGFNGTARAAATASRVLLQSNHSVALALAAERDAGDYLG